MKRNRSSKKNSLITFDLSLESLLKVKNDNRVKSRHIDSTQIQIQIGLTEFESDLDLFKIQTFLKKKIGYGYI